MRQRFPTNVVNMKRSNLLFQMILFICLQSPLKNSIISIFEDTQLKKLTIKTSENESSCLSTNPDGTTRTPKPLKHRKHRRGALLAPGSVRLFERRVACTITSSSEILKIDDSSVEFLHKVSFEQTVGVDSEVWLNDTKQWLLVYRMKLDEFPNDLRYSCGLYSMLGTRSNSRRPVSQAGAEIAIRNRGNARALADDGPRSLPLSGFVARRGHANILRNRRNPEKYCL